MVIWPALGYPAGVFTRDYFKFWVGLIVIWSLLGTIVIVVLPIFESRRGLMRICRGILNHTNGLMEDMDQIDYVDGEDTIEFDAKAIQLSETIKSEDESKNPIHKQIYPQPA